MAGTTIGSALEIPDSVLKRIDEVDKKLQDLQQKASTTATSIDHSFSNMASSTDQFNLKLDGTIQKLNLVATAAGNANTATSGFGQQNVGGMQSFNNAIQQAITNINRMAASLQSGGSTGASGILSARQAVQDLIAAMKNTSGMNIAYLKEEIKAIETNLKDTTLNLTKADQDALIQRKKLLQDELKEQERTANQRAETYAKAIDKMLAAEERFQNKQKKNYANRAKDYQKQNEERNSTYSGSLQFSASANTLSRQQKAIEYLSAARMRLNTADADYKQKLEALNAAINRHSKALRDAGVAAMGTTEAMSYLSKYTSQLMQRMAVLFSFNMASGFIGNIIDIRGQFEMSQRSLEAILQNKPKADEIFNKTVELAVKSPFRIKDLVQYTRQLSAYRIEEDKLYDTTKRLADVSAGLGVDMQRIILAYGQIKATGYLRGGEVRQLTEAGIGIYQELVDYYRTQGKELTVKQIADMIPRKQISFADVEAVFNRMTSQGGTFYNMQEVQSETLEGKINNFKDSLDVMYNDIGRKNEDTIKGLISFATEMMGSWEKIVGVAETLGLAILALNANWAEGVVFGRLFGGLLREQVVAFQLNSAAVGKFKAALLILKDGAVATIGALGRMAKGMTMFLILDTIIGGIQKWNESVKRLAEIASETTKMKAGVTDIADEYAKIAGSANKAANEADELKKKIGFEPNGKYDLTTPDSAATAKTSQTDQTEATQSVKKAADEQAKAVEAASEKEKKSTNESVEAINKKREVLQKLVNVAKQNGFVVNIDIAGLDKSELDKKFNEVRTSYEDFITYVTVARQRVNSMNSNFFTENIFGIGSIIDGIDENAKDYQNAVNEIIVNSYKLDDAIAVIKTQYTAVTDKQKAYVDEIRAGRKTGEDQIDYYTRMYTLMRAIRGGGGKWKLRTEADSQGLERYNDAMEVLFRLFERSSFGTDLNSQSKTFERDVLKMLGSVDEVKRRWKNDPMKIKAVIDDAALIGEWGEASKRLAYRIAEKRYGIKINEDKQNIKDTAWAIQEQLQRELDDKKINIKVAAMLSNQLGGYSQTQDDLDGALKTARENLKIAKEYKKIGRWFLGGELIKGQMDFSGIKTNKGKDVGENTMVSPDIVIDKLNEQINALLAEGAKDKKDTKAEKAQRDILNERIQLLKDMAARYKELLELESKESALSHTREYFAEAAQNVSMDINSFVPDKATVAKKIRGIAKEYKELNKRGSGLRVAADLEFDVRKDNLQKQLDKIKADAEELFNKRELHVKLVDIGLDEASIQRMFGKLPNNWNDVRNGIDERYAADNGSDKSQWGADVLKQYQEEIKNLDKKIYDEQVNNVQELTKAYKTQLSDQLQLYTWYTDERRKIEENAQLSKDPALQGQYLENLNKQYAQKMDENTWKGFQNSDAYIRLFEDLGQQSGRSLNYIHDKLASMRTELANLDPTQLKAISDQMEKIEDTLNGRNPLEAFTSGLAGMIKYGRELRRLGGVEKYISLNKDYDNTNAKMEHQEVVLKNLKDEYNARLKNNNLTLAQEEMYDTRIKQEESVLKKLKDQSKSQKKQIDTLGNVMTLSDKAKKQFVQSISDINEIVSALGTGFSGLMDALGQSTPQLQTAMSILDGVGGAIASAYQKNWAGVVSGVFQAAQGVASLFMDESDIDDRLEELSVSLSRLQKAYDKLKTAVEAAWDLGSLNDSTDDAQANLEKQIRTYQSMVEAEKSRKDPDDTQIQEWQEKIDDCKESIKELQEAQIEALGGFGSEANYKSAAQEFADAWVDAFNSGEDALEALNDKMDEYIENLIKKQAMLRLAKKYLEPVFKAIDNAVDESSDGGMALTQAELETISSLSKTAASGLNESMEKLMEILGYTSSNSSGLDSLQQGIQGVTESTATALESILNSMRFYLATQQADVATIRLLLQNRLGVMDDTSNTTSTPIITELQSQTQYIKAISSSLDSVIKSGHRLGGKGIKVYME